MDNQTKKYNVFLIVFAVGALSGLILTALSTWADLEAAYYGFSRRASTRLTGLSCPILMTANESNVISLKLSNKTDGKISPSVQVETSSPVSAFKFAENIELPAGERTTREWAVGPENLDLKHFIFAKALVYSAYPYPDGENTCGVFVLNFPGNGTIIAWAMIMLCVLGMGAGLNGAHQMQGQEQSGVEVTYQLMFLSIIILVGLVTAFTGWWILGILVLVVSLLFILISAGIFIGRSSV